MEASGPLAAPDFVGLPLSEAAELAESRGWESRVSCRDGEQFLLTADFVESRVNFSVEAGVVVDAVRG